MSSIKEKTSKRAMASVEKKKVITFFKEMKGKVIFSKKVKKAEENLKKAKLI